MLLKVYDIEGVFMQGHDIIVIGASAGGVETLKQLVSLLPKDLAAAVFIVLHVPAHGHSVLPKILSRAGVLPAVHAEDGQQIEPGKIYIAPPDRHLLVKEDCIMLSRGPKENGHRPAVDPLFRSASRAYARRVVGVVLSGVLDDGTSGLMAVKMRQGIAVVQDPDEAIYTGMPNSAITNVDVDYILPVAEIAALLVRLAQDAIPEETVISSSNGNLDKEVEIAEMTTQAIPSGVPAVWACPECGGTLWELHEGNLMRFRCRVGHAFSAQSLLVEQSEQIEDAFWAALRALEESASLARRMAEHAQDRGQNHVAQRFQDQAANAEARADVVRKVIESGILNIAVDHKFDEQLE
jgi:two-component system, chemotaxis family, protein-glutamate methylesterase/glutaminase